jgi:hypothetical protein
MKTGFASLAAVALAAITGAPNAGQAANNFSFPLVVSSGALGCVQSAEGRVTLNALGIFESMHIEVSGLPPKTDFDVFLIQVPTAPFGMAWYQGDIETDGNGNGVADFAGRFSIETFVVAPGTAPAPRVFTETPFPDAKQNPATGPIHTYHIGIWFNSPADAANAGCPGTVTPFNGTHNAGIQVLNTGNFGDLHGPLRQFRP